LYQVQKKDIRRAALMLADAFHHDPVWNAVFGDAAIAQRAAAFETPVRYGLKYGEVYAPSEILEGVAAWLPGTVADMTFWRILRSGALWPGMKIGAQIMRKMQPVFRPIEIDRRETMRGKSYLYLQIIGVAPAFQGKGFAGRLLRALIVKRRRPALFLSGNRDRKQRQHVRNLGFTVIKKFATIVNFHVGMTQGG
jgi:GNAT superfamily N-acetyltransferase